MRFHSSKLGSIEKQGLSCGARSGPLVVGTMKKLVFRFRGESGENGSMFRVSERRMCAFCRSERWVYVNKHVSFFDVVGSAIAAVTLGLLIWQDFDPRSLVLFAGALLVAEIFVLFRRRFSLICDRCGFDPLVYRKNPAVAAKRVREFLDRRREDPLASLMSQPNLPVLFKRAENPIKKAAQERIRTSIKTSPTTRDPMQ